MTEREPDEPRRDDEAGADEAGTGTDEEREELAQRGRLRQTEEEEEGPDEAA